jgi:hypothetical protein
MENEQILKIDAKSNGIVKLCFSHAVIKNLSLESL